MKKIILIVGGVLALLIAVVLIGPGMVDWNRYKAEIQAQAMAATGRNLTIKGDIKISVLPAPALIAHDVTLANMKGATSVNMVGLKLLEVRINLAPLLAGRVEVKRVKLVEPVIELEVLADGRNNWTFQPGQPGGGNTAPVPLAKGQAASDAEPAPKTPQETVQGAGRIAVDNFTIENGTLIYRDAKNATLERVDDINATISAASLAGPFESSGALRARAIPLSYAVHVGEIIHDRTVPFNLKLGAKSSGGQVQVSGTLVGLADTPKIKGKLKGEGKSLAGLLQPAAGGAALPGLLDQEFGFDGTVIATAKGGEIKGLNLRLGKAQATGELSVKMGKEVQVAASLTASRIDLDKWLALPPVGAESPDASSKVAKAKTSGDGQAPNAAAAPDNVTQVPAAEFQLPRGINVSLALKANAVTYRGGVIREVVANADLANGEATLSQLSAVFPGGSNMAIFGFVTAQDGKPRFEGEVESSVGDLRAVLSWLGQNLDGVKPDRLRKLTLATRVVAVPEQLQLTGLDVQFDSSRLTGGIALALSKRLSFGADLTIDRLDLDAYLPQSSAKKKAAPKKNQKTAKPEAGSGDEKPAKAKDPLSALKLASEIDANLKMAVKSLVFRGARIKDVTIDGTLYDGGLEIRKLGVAHMAGASLGLSGAIKDFAGSPEATNLAFKAQVGDMGALLSVAGLDPALAPKGLGPVKVAGRIDGNLLAPTLNLTATGAGATAKIKGQLDGLAVIPTAKGLNVRLDTADATRLLKLAGIDAKGAAKQLGPLSVNATIDGNLLTPSLALDLKAAGGTVSVKGPLNMLPVGDLADLAVTANVPDLARLARALGTGYRPSGKIGGLALQARLKGGAKGMTITGITAQMGPTSGTVDVNGDVVVGLQGPRPVIKANLMAGAIILDPFLPAQKSASLWNGLKILPAAFGAGLLSNEDGPLVRAATRRGGAAERWSRDPIDLSGLSGVDAEITLKSPLVQLEDYKLSNADLVAKLAAGKIIAEKLTGQVFGGAFHATGSATATNRPRIETTIALENMSIGQATQAFTGKSVASGRLGLKTRLQSSGKNIYDMIRGLSGSGSLRLKGVDVKQGNTGTALAGALGLVSALGQFSNVLGGGASKGSGLVDISGSFDITGGIARTQDAKVVSSAGNGSAAGAIDLPRWLIDVKGQVQLEQNLLTSFLAAKSKRNITSSVPFTVKGRLDAPTINLDTSKITGGGLPVPGADRLLKKLPKGVGGVLQGILGGGAQQQQQQGTSTGGSTGSEPPPPPQEQQQQQIDPVDLLKGLFKRR
ncbi:MAG: AsmA family protein [Proteobacteria bacterium]|nr:AsmA family protein [Pseudomonadota bacterium]MDA1021969.1 AsmA family protein [Pseudomonadota bacterium]